MYRSQKNHPWLSDVICGDIKNFNSNKKYDIIFWWHGPEHLLKEDIPSTLINLEHMCNNIIILGCPWGEYKMDNVIFNPAGHNSHNDYDIFENLGYTVECLGAKNVHGSNITAVKYITGSVTCAK